MIAVVGDSVRTAGESVGITIYGRDIRIVAVGEVRELLGKK